MARKNLRSHPGFDALAIKGKAHPGFEKGAAHEERVNRGGPAPAPMKMAPAGPGTKRKPIEADERSSSALAPGGPDMDGAPC
jgi:hypothetical protein